MCRLMTPRLTEALDGYPLYSQDGKGKEAVCRAIFALGAVRWFILEGEKEGNDTILFGIVVGLAEDEYGYIYLNELWRTRQTLWRAVQMLTQKLCCQTIHDCPKVVPLHYESE